MQLLQVYSDISTLKQIKQLVGSYIMHSKRSFLETFYMITYPFSCCNKKKKNLRNILYYPVLFQYKSKSLINIQYIWLNSVINNTVFSKNIIMPDICKIIYLPYEMEAICLEISAICSQKMMAIFQYQLLKCLPALFCRDLLLPCQLERSLKSLCSATDKQNKNKTLQPRTILTISSILRKYIHKRETSCFIKKKKFKKWSKPRTKNSKAQLWKELYNLLLVLKVVVEIKIYL